MQTPEMKQSGRGILLPVPEELMEEAGLRASDVIQYYAAPGRLVVEAIRDPELLREVLRDQENMPDTGQMTLLEFLDSLSKAEQYAALMHLSVLWAEGQG